MTSVFRLRQQKFRNKIEIAPKLFWFFFNRKSSFFTQTNFFQKKLHANFIFFLHNVVLDT